MRAPLRQENQGAINRHIRRDVCWAIKCIAKPLEETIRSTIEREYGSGAREIARELASRLVWKLWDERQSSQHHQEWVAAIVVSKARPNL
jgi:hypothetical protein